MDASLNLPVPLDPLTEDIEIRRLWVGNLDPRVTEFILLKLLQQYGSIEKFDLLFHRSGPLEGQPRGYAFVTYTTADSAKKALDKLNGKLVGSKAFSVKWANTLKKDDYSAKEKVVPNIPALAGTKREIKLSKVIAIQAIEAKLKTMEATSTSLDFEVNKKPCASTAGPISHLKKTKHKGLYKNKCKPYFKTKCK